LIIIKVMNRWWVCGGSAAGQIEYLTGPHPDRATARFSKRRLENRLGIERLRQVKQAFLSKDVLDELERIEDTITSMRAAGPTQRTIRQEQRVQLEAERRRDRARKPRSQR
jgi:hypothetical protein